MKGTRWRSKQNQIIFRNFYFNFDHKQRATWKFCTSMPFPFSAMERIWVKPNFPAHRGVELPVQSKWKAQACNTRAGRELRGWLHSKLLQQLNLNTKLNSLRGLITALTAAQVIPEWDITPIISIYYRIDIRYHCICHYLCQGMRVSGKLETRNLLGLRLRPLHCEEMCVCVDGKHFWGTLLAVDSHPEPCQFPWHRPRQDEPRAEPDPRSHTRSVHGPRGTQRSLLGMGLCSAAHTHTCQGFDSWARTPPDLGTDFSTQPCRLQRTSCAYTEARRRAAAFALSNLLQVLQQRCSRLIFVNSPSLAC